MYKVMHYRLWKDGTWTKMLLKKGSLKECEEITTSCNNHEIKFHMEPNKDISFYRVETEGV